MPSIRSLLVATALAVVVTSAPAPSTAVPVEGESGARALPSAGGVTPGYHYGATFTQVLPDGQHSRGVRATFTVHRPKQVKGSKGQHSLGQIAVGDTGNRAFVEAGWRQYVDGPRLFVFWRPADGSGTCYDFGCGFRDRGPGKRPGVMLKPGTRITIGFKFQNRKWWLMVNGKRSGFYPTRLWNGTFTSSDYSSIFGEVYTKRSQRLCADMGNGKRAKRVKAAKVTDVRFYGGPEVQLSVSPDSDLRNYSVKLTGDTSFRYGGPGRC